MRVTNNTVATRANLAQRIREAKASGKKTPAYAKNGSRAKNELNDFNTVLNNFKAHKMAKLGESKVTYKEVRMLREAVANANRKGVKLAEADENFQAQSQAPAATGTAPAASEVSPDIQTQIQSLLSQVQALAQSAGINTADLSADPNANIPAVDGMATADAANPQAGQDSQLMEAVAKVRKENNGKCDEAQFAKVKAQFGKALVESLGATRDRIAMRSAKLDTLSENFKGDFASAYFNNIGLKEAVSPIAGIPSEKEIAKGTADATNGLAKELKTPVAWPDHQITGAPLQGTGAKQQKVKESVSSPVTDAYVKDYFGAKLSMDTIRESMQKGLLG